MSEEAGTSVGMGDDVSYATVGDTAESVYGTTPVLGAPFWKTLRPCCVTSF